MDDTALLQHVKSWLEQTEEAPKWGGPTMFPAPLLPRVIQRLYELAKTVVPTETPKPAPEPRDHITYADVLSYRDNQVKLREAGFTPYNCDMVDEFPQW